MHLVGFIMRIYHDTWLSECQVQSVVDLVACTVFNKHPQPTTMAGRSKASTVELQ